jgi:hypothetical protein
MVQHKIRDMVSDNTKTEVGIALLCNGKEGKGRIISFVFKKKVHVYVLVGELIYEIENCSLFTINHAETHAAV